jgi:hypothetical protein
MEEGDRDLLGLELAEMATSAVLRGRQSVRTTFKLSEQAIDALSILAGQLGIKQKSLVDHLIEDTRALEVIAGEFAEFGHQQRVAKTYVVSRRTLENLERVSLRFNTPRDALVEHSIQRILPLLQREKQRHAERKVTLGELRDYLAGGEALLARAEQALGEDDPVCQELQTMLRGMVACLLRVEDCVARGRKIEDFSSSGR